MAFMTPVFSSFFIVSWVRVWFNLHFQNCLTESFNLIYSKPYFVNIWKGVVQEKCKKKSKGSYCAAYDCHDARGNCKLSMFWFPKDKEQCLKWVQNSRRDDLRNIPVHKLYNYELCSNHFEESQFTNKEKKNWLIQTAVPTLFDVPNPPAKVTLSWPIKTWTSKCTPTKSKDPVSTPTSQKLDTPRRKKLKRKVQALWTKLWRKSHDKSLGHKAAIAKVMAQLKQYLPIDTVKFIERQIILHESHVHQRRYATIDKMMALSIFYQSRKAYQLAFKTFCITLQENITEKFAKDKHNARVQWHHFWCIEIESTYHGWKR